MTALRARVVSGNPPAAVQLKGPGIQEWAREGALNDVEDVASREAWDKVLPPVLAGIMKYEGKYVAAPVNIHRVDWMWANPEVLARVGVTEMPDTWDEFNSIAEKLKAAGITPLAHGGQGILRFPLTDRLASKVDSRVGEEISLGLRPEAIGHRGAYPSGTSVFAFERVVDVVEPTGPDTMLVFTLGGVEAIARIRPEEKVPAGTPFSFEVNMDKAKLFDPATGVRL